MTALRSLVNTNLVTAMKAGEKKTVTTLRMLQAAVKNKEIDLRTQGPEEKQSEDALILDIIAKMIKQRQDSIQLYEKGGRNDLVESEQAEITILEAYLPKQLDDEGITKATAEVIEALQASGMKDMGRVIAKLKGQYAGQMDMGRAATIVKAQLAR